MRLRTAHAPPSLPAGQRAVALGRIPHALDCDG
jgi:hypothetical protein